MKKPIKKKTKLINVTIDRKRWMRSDGSPRSDERKSSCGLRDSKTGMQCCLGFVARAFGYTTSQINDEHFLSDLKDSDGPKIPQRLINIEHDLASLNDGDVVSTRDDGTVCRGPEREQRIAKLLLKGGVRAKFVG